MVETKRMYFAGSVVAMPPRSGNDPGAAGIPGSAGTDTPDSTVTARRGSIG
jgi:hypothetical protein